MGRNLPSTTQMVLSEIAGLERFYGGLARTDQLVLDKFFEAILQQRAAIGNAASLMPIQIMPWIILLELHKVTHRDLDELSAAIQELENRRRRIETRIARK